MLMKISEFCKTFDFSPEHVRRKVRSGAWPAYKFGVRSWRLDPEQIRKLGRVRSKKRDADREPR